MEMERMFRKFDANGNGKISNVELAEALRTLGSISHDDVHRIVAKLDTDGDGFVEFEEYAAFCRINSGLMKDVSKNETDQSQQTAMDSSQFPLVTNGLLTNQIMGTNPQLLTNGLPNQFPYQFPPPYQIPPEVQQPQLTKLDLRLQLFWAQQLQEITVSKDFKNHSLPLARIKKIMKADEDVKMIAAETPVLFSKACELFILELTHRSCFLAEQSKRRTLLKSDISLAVANHQMFDFLEDIVPVEEVAEGGMAAATVIPGGEELNQSIPCFYDPSKFSPLIMDIGHSEMVPHGSAFAQQHQYGNALENGETTAPNLPP